MALRGSPMQWELAGAVPQGIYEVVSTAKLILGQKLILGDRVFRYAQAAGTALAAGKLMSVLGALSNHADIATTTAVAGATTVTVTLGATAAAANLYADGYLFVNDDTGEGFTFRIKSHPQADASASLIITLYDEIIIAFAAGTTVTLVENIYKDVIIFPATTQAGVAIGVPPVLVPLDNFFWLQTWGPACVLRDEATVANTPLVPGASTDGSLEDFDSGGSLEQVVAFADLVGVDTEYNPCFMRINP